MKRNLKQLTSQPFDLLIIGCGIYGVFIAWDAALRGLSVAVVDKNDFGGATSSNNLRIIHGGLRYLQHGDFQRMRESIRERLTLMRIAPHLVHPLPFVIPTYGHFMRGKEIMSLALAMNDLIGFDRNSLHDPQKYLPRGHVISKQECLRRIPGLDTRGLTGGAVWYDGQMHNSERLVLSVLRSAAGAGAEMANYVKVTGFLQQGTRVFGVEAEDVLSGEKFDIKAGLVVNASGPWVGRVLGLLRGLRSGKTTHLSKAMNIIVRRQLVSEYAVGVFSSGRSMDQDAIIRKRGRLLFITPWRNHSLIGTTHEGYAGEADNLELGEADIEHFIHEVNNAYPAASLKRKDVTFFHGGLLPASRNSSGDQDVNLLKRYRIVDHLKTDGVDRLVSVVGVKYTTARDVAEKTVDLVFAKFGKKAPRSQTSEKPIHGGKVDRFDEFLNTAVQKESHLSPEVTRHLVYSYGSAYPEVLDYLKSDPGAAQRICGQSPVIKAEILQGIREEMAQKLVDVIMRRTELGSCGHPGDAGLQKCADIVAAEMGWSRSRIDRELAEARALFPSVDYQNLPTPCTAVSMPHPG